MLGKFNNPDLSLLLVRIAVGLVFIAHGWAKFASMDKTVGFFASLGLAAVIAYAVAAIELAGGVMVLLGAWSRCAGLALAAVMVGAILTAKASRGFMGGYEFELTLALASLALAFAGSGKYSVKALLKKESAVPLA